MCNTHNPPLTTYNGAPSSFVCSAQPCTIVLPVSFAAHRSLTPISRMIHNHSLLEPLSQNPSTPLLNNVSQSYNSITLSSLLSLCHIATPLTSTLNTVSDLRSFTAMAIPNYYYTHILHVVSSSFVFPPIRYCTSNILLTPNLHVVLDTVNDFHSFAAVPFPTSSTYTPTIRMSTFLYPHNVVDCSLFFVAPFAC